jgi:Tfp pilus assembly protein PilP
VRVLITVLLSASALALGACGESSQDKAKSTVCDARADIGKQVDQLKGLTITTASVAQVQQGLKAINDDLSKIKDAQGDLSDDRRQQVQTANQAFAGQLKNIASTLGSGLTLSTAKTQFTSALQQLSSAYQQTFAKIDCS